MLRKNLDLSRTLFALSSGSLPSAVAIVKLVGPQSFALGEKVFRPRQGTWDRTRGMIFGELVDLHGQRFDEVLCLRFVGPDSHTGDDILEFHCHGSIAIVQKLKQLLEEGGALPAEPGELTYRALMNGKVSAEQVETLGDLFLAREEKDLTRIYGRREGSLESAIQCLREQAMRLQAILDTAVDFADEYSSVVSAASTPLEASIRECSAIIQRYSIFKSGSQARRLVIAGRPNAGKSSLFNAILGRYRAIVHREAGTTRDVIEEDLSLGGHAWKLVDTAGVRKSNEEREQEGIALGESFLAGASAWLLVVDGTEGLSDPERNLIAKYGSTPHRIVWNKSDLDDWRAPDLQNVISLSARSGQGLKELSEELLKIADDLGESHEALPSSVQVVRLREVERELQTLKAELNQDMPPEILGERGREILRKLEAVTGEISTEEVLGRVFSEFCIGK